MTEFMEMMELCFFMETADSHFIYILSLEVRPCIEFTVTVPASAFPQFESRNTNLNKV